MKKGFVAILAAIALAATSLIGTSIAGIGPARGLPNVNVAPAAGFYQVTNTSVPGVNGSVMCVACHTRNPATRTAYKANAGFLGSHFVTSNFTDTSTGGGYTDNPVAGKSRGTRIASAIYMAASTAANYNWPTAPKYGLGSTTAINANTNDPTTAGAQMICESCHNIVYNIGPAKLLATGFANGARDNTYTVGSSAIAGHGPNTITPTLCVGCHGRMSAGVSAEWQLHPIGATAWTGTHHHRNTGTAYYFGAGTETATHDMGSMARSYYTPAVQMWGAAYGELGATDRVPTYDPGVNKKMRNDTNSAVGATPVGQIAVANANQVLCTNCHRAHNANTTAGSTILMSTTSAAIGVTAPANDGLQGFGVLGRANIQNTNPICLACHQ